MTVKSVVPAKPTQLTYPNIAEISEDLVRVFYSGPLVEKLIGKL
jgi:hypothetical protein